jgi:hypothetical protein
MKELDRSTRHYTISLIDRKESDYHFKIHDIYIKCFYKIGERMRKEVVISICEMVNEIPKIKQSTHYIFLHREKHYTNTRCHL